MIRCQSPPHTVKLPPLWQVLKEESPSFYSEKAIKNAQPRPKHYGKIVKTSLDWFSLCYSLYEIEEANSQGLNFVKDIQEPNALAKSSQECDKLAQQLQVALSGFINIRNYVQQEQSYQREEADSPLSPIVPTRRKQGVDNPLPPVVPTKRKRRRISPNKCLQCSCTETPQWRKGPNGQRTLCNACGLHYAKTGCLRIILVAEELLV